MTSALKIKESGLSGRRYIADGVQITRTYTYGPGVDDIQSMTTYEGNEGPKTYYYIKDASNTVHVLVDEDGLIVEYYYYDAFGNLKMRDKDYNLITESVYGNRFLFQGREYDYDTALYYFRARWYEPETGRWLSPDPIGISGGLNLYAFCGNDPVNFVDPSGLAIVRNNTPWPIVVSGGLGTGKGHGNRKNYYAVIPPGGTGGGEYPLAVYETPAKAIAAYNSPSFIPPDSKYLLFDVDNYHDYACNLENASIPPVSTKIDGNDFGFIYDLIDQDGKITSVMSWSFFEITSTIAREAYLRYKERDKTLYYKRYIHP